MTTRMTTLVTDASRQQHPRVPGGFVPWSVALIAIATDWLTPPDVRTGIFVLACAALLVTLGRRRLALAALLASSWFVVPAASGALWLGDLARGQQRIFAIQGEFGAYLVGTELHAGGDALEGVPIEALDRCTRHFAIEPVRPRAAGPFQDVVWTFAVHHNALVLWHAERDGTICGPRDYVR